MDIEIITTTATTATTANDVYVPDEPNNSVNSIEVVEPTILEHSNRKVLSKTDIDNVIDKVFASIMDYLTEHTEFEHMRDEIINQRMRAITKEKYTVHIEHTINNFIKFLNQDESILEYIEDNGKLIYGTGDDIDDLIVELIYTETAYVYDIAQGWLSWDNYRCHFPNNNNFLGQNVLINNIIKYVFEQYGNGFEYLDDTNISTNDNKQEPASETEQEPEQEPASETEQEQKNNDDCVIC